MELFFVVMVVNGYLKTCVYVCPCMPLCAKSLQLCPRLWAPQTPLSMAFSRQEYWIGFPYPLKENLLDPGIATMSLKSPALADRFLTTRAAWEVPCTCTHTHTHTHTCVCVYTYILFKTLLVYLDRMPFNYISSLSLYFVVQSLSRVWLFVTPWAAACLASLSFTRLPCPSPGFSVLHHLLELAQTHIHWVSDAIQPSCPLS